jgi:hypothetical protein
MTGTRKSCQRLFEVRQSASLQRVCALVGCRGSEKMVDHFGSRGISVALEFGY